MRKEDLPPKYQRQVEQKLGVQTAKNAVKTNKYHAVKETVGNIKFDSKKEKMRFDELMLMEQSGEIRDLKLQHEFLLQGAFTDTTGERTRSIKYIADFTYWQGNTFVIEDVKSAITAKDKTYRMKKKMMAEKGWKITEI